MKEVFGIITGIGLTYYISLVVATVFKLFVSRRRHERSHIGNFLPPISVLKPVTGVDGNLRNNLLSFINQDYPEFEIIVGVQSSNDPAIKLVGQLKQEFPSKNIHIIISNQTLGYNPKINNLYGMISRAKYDYAIISDSNVIVGRDYLRSNISYFEDREVGLVTNLIKGIGGESVGALFENLHLNSFVIGNVSLLDLFQRKIVVGKSIFFRRSQFERLGGLWELRNYLAEDYLMGKLYKENGYKVVVAPNLVCTTNHSWTIKRFINRHTRWAQLRWNLNKTAYISELLFNFPLLSLIFAIACGFSYESSMIAALCWAAKVMGDSLMNSLLKTGLGVRHCLAAPFKDLLIGFLWIVPIVNRRTSWRGTPVRIARNTLLLPTN
ncbi:MAG TPA: glycosyltransferase [Candidatus Acidoferrales bacterium]|nr:glycosyltransferase [Candidatus Acidoferrales bacterium]